MGFEAKIPAFGEAHRLADTPRKILHSNMAIICHFMGQVSLSDVLGKSREHRLMPARAAIARYLRERGWSYPSIGKVMGGRDHTTIMHCANREYFDGQLELEEQIFGQLQPVVSGRGYKPSPAVVPDFGCGEGDVPGDTQAVCRANPAGERFESVDSVSRHDRADISGPDGGTGGAGDPDGCGG